MMNSRHHKRFGVALSAAAVLTLGIIVGSVQQPAVASGASGFKLDQAGTSTTPPPTTLATASASPTDKAPPFGKK